MTGEDELRADAEMERYWEAKDIWESSHFDSLFDDFIENNDFHGDWLNFVSEEAIDLDHAKYLQENDSFLKEEFITKHEDMWNEWVSQQFKEYGSD